MPAHPQISHEVFANFSELRPVPGTDVSGRRVPPGGYTTGVGNYTTGMLPGAKAQASGRGGGGSTRLRATLPQNTVSPAPSPNTSRGASRTPDRGIGRNKSLSQARGTEHHGAFSSMGACAVVLDCESGIQEAKGNKKGKEDEQKTDRKLRKRVSFHSASLLLCPSFLNFRQDRTTWVARLAVFDKP